MQGQRCHRAEPLSLANKPSSVKRAFFQPFFRGDAQAPPPAHAQGVPKHKRQKRKKNRLNTCRIFGCFYFRFERRLLQKGTNFRTCTACKQGGHKKQSKAFLANQNIGDIFGIQNQSPLPHQKAVEIFPRLARSRHAALTPKKRSSRRPVRYSSKSGPFFLQLFFLHTQSTFYLLSLPPSSGGSSGLPSAGRLGVTSIMSEFLYPPSKKSFSFFSKGLAFCSENCPDIKNL